MNWATHRMAKMNVISGMLLVLLPILHAQEEGTTIPEVDESAIPAQLGAVPFCGLVDAVKPRVRRWLLDWVHL